MEMIHINEPMDKVQWFLRSLGSRIEQKEGYYEVRNEYFTAQEMVKKIREKGLTVLVGIVQEVLIVEQIQGSLVKMAKKSKK